MSDSTTTVHDEFFESLLGDFLDESGQLLDRLNENLLALDEWVRCLDGDQPRRCDDDLLNEMFRAAHSLKGLSAMLGLTEINSLTHKIENVFDAARRDQLAIGSDVVELMFQGIDRLGSLVESLRGDGPSVECESVARAIADLLRDAGAERHPTTQADAERALESPASGPAGPAAAYAIAPPDPAASTAAGGEPDRAGALHGEEAAAAGSFAAIEDEADLGSKYVPIFIDEAGISLDTITETLLAIESGGSPAELERLLITSHRIKGSAASVGFNRAAKLAHLMEDLLQELRERGHTLSSQMIDAMLHATDTLRTYVDGLRQGRNDPVDFESAAMRLIETPGPDASARVPSGETIAPARPARSRGAGLPPAHPTAELLALVAARTGDPDDTLVGVVRFEPDLPLAGLKGRLIYEKLIHLGSVCHFDPPMETLDDLDTVAGVQFGLVTAMPVDDVRRHLRVGGVYDMFVAPLAGGDPAPTVQADFAASAAAPEPAGTQRGSNDAADEAEHAASGRSRASEAATKPTETLRVDTERLDQLMNLAGELVINKARFVKIGESMRSALALRQSQLALNNICNTLTRMADDGDSALAECDPRRELEVLRSQARWMQSEMEGLRRDFGALGTVRDAVLDLFEAVHQLDRISDGIQQNVMDTRMVPIGPLFGRFKRVVRDITRGNGRLIRLEIDGEKTELDKRMIDELGDPLIHMVRNAADHGIEPPEVRTACGKPREGTISLRAFHRGNSIVIQVIDDGKGLDPQRILQKALERGLVAEADAEKLTRQQVFQLIWEPGLSTAERVTEVSGRGMGMDIVKSKIEDLHGTVELDSTPGAGTTLTIKLPLTLAILPSLMVEIDGDVFAMPLEAVAEIVRVGAEHISTIHGRRAAQVRGRVVSMICLRDHFQWHSDRREEWACSGETTLVIIGEEGRELGLAVDRIIGEEDVVIKSIAENYRNVPGIAGASILGDGRVSLILDLGALMQMASAGS